MPEHAQLTAKTLQALHADLTKLIMPELQSSNAKVAAAMIGDILRHFAVWQSEMPNAIVNHIAVQQNLLTQAPVTATAVIDGLASDYPDAPPAYFKTAASLGAAVAASSQSDRAWLAKVNEADLALYAQEDQLMQAEVRDAPGRLARVEVEVTEDLLMQLFEAHLGADASRTIESFARASGGYSKDTFLVEVRSRGGSQSLAIRRDMPAGPTEKSVLDEFEPLVKLKAAGLPIAKPLFADAAAILGQPAIASVRVSGAAGTADWQDDPVRRARLCKQFASMLANLHRIEPGQVLPTTVNEPREALRAYVLEWQDRWLRNRVHPSPLLEVAFRWLLDNIPQRIERLAIVHGDVGFHNMMTDGDQVTAVLDWEFVHVGDAIEDLSYCRPAIEALMPWDEFLSMYTAEGGVRYQGDSARFFNTWRSVRNAVCCAVSWRGFVSGAYPALKMAYLGIALYRHFLRDVATNLKGVL